MTLEHQELQFSTGVCTGCSIFQSRSELESILSFRKVRKISVTDRNIPKPFFFSLGSLSRELHMLNIAMIHALYYVSQRTAPLLKVLPFTCYLISVIRGQWIQPKVLPWLISKQKPCIPWNSLFQMEYKPHTGQEPKFFRVTFLGCDSESYSFVTDFRR